ncbi:MAG: LytTR family DNA-binding domain-containing protein [Lachnospiraceae bacterium]|nr:response regulator transcription factor [Lachnospiraceae bacterium]MEE1256358.1 LytTR family DNA-binding domain-containing protein [Lachnospiraceae bacterium]
MRIAVCDDEEKYRVHVKTELEKIVNSIDVVIDSFAQGEDLLKKIENKPYDIIFLDIEMPTMDGITIAKKIREQSENMELVFLTNHVEYALEGYEVNALRYLTKPVNPVKLQEVISYMIKREKNRKIIWVKNKDCEEKILVTDIIFMEAQNQKVEIHTKDKVYVHRYNMGDYEKELETDGFFRIHRGYLVALGSIESFGHHEVRMEDGTVLPVSKTKEKKLKDALFQYVKEVAI